MQPQGYSSKRPRLPDAVTLHEWNESTKRGRLDKAPGLGGDAWMGRGRFKRGRLIQTRGARRTLGPTLITYDACDSVPGLVIQYERLYRMLSKLSMTKSPFGAVTGKVEIKSIHRPVPGCTTVAYGINRPDRE